MSTMDMKITWEQDRQKSYVDQRMRDLEFEIGDKVFLRISPLKGIVRFGKRDKLKLRYIRPYEILDRFGKSAYRLALPPQLAQVHNVFNVRCSRNTSYTHNVFKKTNL